MKSIVVTFFALFLVSPIFLAAPAQADSFEQIINGVRYSCTPIGNIQEPMKCVQRCKSRQIGSYGGTYCAEFGADYCAPGSPQCVPNCISRQNGSYGGTYCAQYGEDVCS